MIAKFEAQEMSPKDKEWHNAFIKAGFNWRVADGYNLAWGMYKRTIYLDYSSDTLDMLVYYDDEWSEDAKQHLSPENTFSRWCVRRISTGEPIQGLHREPDNLFNFVKAARSGYEI